MINDRTEIVYCFVLTMKAEQAYEGPVNVFANDPWFPAMPGTLTNLKVSLTGKYIYILYLYISIYQKTAGYLAIILFLQKLPRNESERRPPLMCLTRPRELFHK